MSATKLTVLNVMAGDDFGTALDRHLAWGISLLDIKAGVFGKSVADLTPEEAARAGGEIAKRDLSVYCLSSVLFGSDIEQGEARFRAATAGPLDRLLKTASFLQPRLIRLLAARSSRRAEFSDAADYVQERHPWLLDAYREAIDQIHAAGFQATIENETHECLFAHPAEISEFFEALDCSGRVHLTWDVQNLWQMGTFPTLDVYEQLKPLIGYYHLKGGRRGAGSDALASRSALEDASWPVIEITKAVIRDGVSPVICLNPSHGPEPPGYDGQAETERDIAFMRHHFPEVF